MKTFDCSVNATKATPSQTTWLSLIPPSAKKHLRWTGVLFYYQKDRIGSKLAAKLSPKQRTLAFPKIHTKTGTLTQSPVGIMDSFHDLYSSLYKDQPDTHPKTRELFLQDLNLPQLKKTHQELLDKTFLLRQNIGSYKNFEDSLDPRAGRILDLLLLRNLAPS